MTARDVAHQRKRARKRKLSREAPPFVQAGPVRESALPWSLYKRLRYRAELEYGGMRTPMLAAVWINDWLLDPQPLPVFESLEKRRRLHTFRLPERVWERFDAQAQRCGREPEALLWDLLAERAPVPGVHRPLSEDFWGMV